MNPTLILQCRAPGLFIAKMIFREMFSALRNSVVLRHVTLRFVTVNLFSNKRTPNGYYVPPWVNKVFRSTVVLLEILALHDTNLIAFGVGAV